MPIKDGLITQGNYLPYNPNLVSRAREMRKNMTLAEQKIWDKYLKHLNVRVLRQRPIDHYIVDFYIPKTNLVIEIDGKQHQNKDDKEYDETRTSDLEDYDLEIIRFTNEMVFYNFSKVVEVLDERLNKQ